ncbi:hypothetical protein ACFL6U_11295 [Planctomycetota bacterium]
MWCATFQVAWNRLRDDVFKGPLLIANAESVVNRLNDSTVTEAVLPSDSYFAAAGRTKDGIIGTIQREMAQKFPDAQPPNFSGAVGFVTYGYLDTKVTFTTPFTDTKQPLRFLDATGVERSVSGFGLHEGKERFLLRDQADQVKVLFSQKGNQSDPVLKPTAFALDLTADQSDQQVIVAVLPRAEQLHTALDDLARRIEEHAPDKYGAKLRGIDTLGIPNVVFDVNHEYTEIQGVDKTVNNPGEFHGLYIHKAFQSIRLRFDKSGAAVVSESGVYSMAAPRHFIVDRPFLIVMKQRSADEPYFVAWIDNTEFLEVYQNVE